MDSNKYLTVSALTQYIKRKFDVDPYLGKIYLTGEISNFRKRPTHQYFSLKDDNAKINVVMFKSAFQKIKFLPEEGMKVLATGHVSVYEKTGQYQLYIDSLEPDGVGQLYEAYEQLKRKLSKEGLFNGEIKKALPLYPKKIAVVTSDSGSVIKDIITTARRRNPKVEITLFPAAVQGEKAGHEIAQQIKRVNDIGGFDELIIGRGGGSIEDLWPFNEEEVARAIYDSKIPVISSVGHETDTTIADLASDQRAATPTAAAELAVPVLSDIQLAISQSQVRIQNATRNLLQSKRQELNRLTSSYIFKSPNRLYESYIQQLDLLTQNLTNHFQNQLSGKRRELDANWAALKLQSPKSILEKQRADLTLKTQSLENEMGRLVADKKAKAQVLFGNLDHLSPLKIMSSGYSMVTNETGKAVKGVADLKTREKIKLNFKDGLATAKVDKIKKG